MKYKGSLIFHRLFILRFFYLFFLIPPSYVLFFLIHPPFFYNVLTSTTSLGRHRTPIPEILRLPHRLSFMVSLSDTHGLVEGPAASLNRWFSARLYKVMQSYARLSKASSQ